MTVYEIRIKDRWWPALLRKDGLWHVTLSALETGFLGMTLGGEAMARRLREGTARVLRTEGAA